MDLDNDSDSDNSSNLSMEMSDDTTMSNRQHDDTNTSYAT